MGSFLKEGHVFTLERSLGEQKRPESPCRKTPLRIEDALIQPEDASLFSDPAWAGGAVGVVSQQARKTLDIALQELQELNSPPEQEEHSNPRCLRAAWS